MRQHNIWCVCVRSVWRGMLDCSYVVYLNKHRGAESYTPNKALLYTIKY